MSRRQHNRLSALQVKSLKEPGRYPDGGGLYLQVSPSGTKSWLFRYARDGRERMAGLGSLITFSLAEAREEAKAARQMVKHGVDPIDAKRDKRIEARLEAAHKVTFKQAAEQFIAANEASWTNAVHRGQVSTTLKTYAFPTLGDLPVSAIDQALVVQVLKPIWATKNATASRVRSRIENVLDFAKANGLRSGDNPAEWEVLKHALGKVKPAKSHHAAMAFADIPAFLSELREKEGNHARALEVTVLTALRTGEVLGARWDEFDLVEKVWTIPAERMKAGEAHKVPLSDRVVEILTGLPREANNPFVFIGERVRRINDRSLFILLQTMRSDLTVHGFRSSFSNWAHERAITDNYTIEMCLAHKVGSAVEQAYLRSTLFAKRELLMAAWSAYCTGEETTGNVVQFTKAG